MVPWRSPTFTHGALNRNVRNDIEGTGMLLFDDQMTCRSSSLRSVQWFAAGCVGHQDTTVHQLGHHWGEESHLAAIAGVPSTGLEQDRHMPLLFPGGTLLDAVLDATRTVERLDSGSVGQVAD